MIRENIDSIAWQRAYQRYALTEPFLWQEANRRLYDRLDCFNHHPKRILVVSPRAGYGVSDLKRRYPDATITLICASKAAYKQLNHLLNPKINPKNILSILKSKVKPPTVIVMHADTREGLINIDIKYKHNALISTQFDLILCNLDLTWLANPVQQFNLFASQLMPNGVLLFNALGSGTATTLNALCEQSGWTTPIAPDFVDMHDYGDMMVQSGLTTPVIDVERFAFSYTSLNTLREDCRGLMNNLDIKRLNQGLYSKPLFKGLKMMIEKTIKETGAMPLEIELVFGHAWKPPFEVPHKPSAQRFNLSDLKATLPSQNLIKSNEKQ